MITGHTSDDRQHFAVADLTRQCQIANGSVHALRDWGLINRLVVHRNSLAAHTKPITEDQLDAMSLAAAFSDPVLGTGGKMPYHFVVCTDGRVEQLLPLGRLAQHAVGSNVTGIGICVVGQKRPASGEQTIGLVELCARLRGLNGGLGVFGHSNPDGGVFWLTDASRHKSKRCPEPVVDMETLAMLLAARTLPLEPRWTCEAAGVVF